MEGLLYLFIFALGILIPVGAVLGCLAFIHRNRQSERIDRLEREVATLRASLAESPETATQPSPSEATEPASQPVSQAASQPIPQAASRPASQPRSRRLKARQQPAWLTNLKDNWMVWLGGVSVGLAGIFMVSHSIATGLIGPTQQFVLALLSGGALHAGAEYLRRKNRGTDQVFAALAGGGSITLYAALLAGVHHFELLSAAMGLALLCLVSLATMVLAVIHGPVLAIMGLGGAYIVPILIGGDDGSIPFLLGYSYLITLSSLLLIRRVYRDWLWYGTLAGALGWWLISVAAAPSQASTAWYLAALFPLFSLLPGAAQIPPHRVREAFLPLIVFWGLSIALQPNDAPFFWSWLLILPATVLLAQSRGSLWYLPWAAVLGSSLGWLGYRLESGPDDAILLLSLPPGYSVGFAAYCAFAVILTVALGLWRWKQDGDLRRWVSLVLLGPLAWLTLAWLILKGYGTSQTWAVCTLILGGLYGFAAWQIERRKRGKNAVLFAIFAAHISYSLAAVMWVREASLTLALAMQFISLAWLARRYEMPELYLLLKAALALVVARLTLNPWLGDYPTDTHWTLWTYGGATACAAIACQLVARSHAMRSWLEAATLHLLVLFLGTETRYWLYDGDIFTHQYSMTEATLNTLLWGALSVTYCVRARASESLAWLYQWGARILLALAGASYISLALFHNPWWASHSISDTPVFNLLLLAYGGPVLVALAASRFPGLAPPRWTLCVAAAAFLLFTALEIRHLWQAPVMDISYGMGEGELYTYSVVGMLYAIIAILLSGKVQSLWLHKGGMALLGLVIAKIFLIDMAGLQGLWRVGWAWHYWGWPGSTVGLDVWMPIRTPDLCRLFLHT